MDEGHAAEFTGRPPRGTPRPGPPRWLAQHTVAGARAPPVVVAQRPSSPPGSRACRVADELEDAVALGGAAGLTYGRLGERAQGRRRGQELASPRGRYDGQRRRQDGGPEHALHENPEVTADARAQILDGSPGL